MNLTEHARRELTEAGWFKKDSEDGMYDGMIGESVMELIEKFAAQGHSGYSAAIVNGLFHRLAGYGILGELKNPTVSGEYIVCSEKYGDIGRDMWQSTRKSSVFSDDKGKTWYDIDKKIPWWKRLFGVKRAYITFSETNHA